MEQTNEIVIDLAQPIETLYDQLKQTIPEKQFQLDEFIQMVKQDIQESGPIVNNIASIDPGFDHLASVYGKFEVDIKNKVIELILEKKRLKDEKVVGFEGI